MKTIGKKLIITLATTFAASCLCAQTVATAAPVTSELSTAHTIFLAPAGIASTPYVEDDVSALYSATYQMLGSLGPYQMTTKAAEADLDAQVSVVVTPSVNVAAAASLRLAIFDAKTRTLLWTIDAPLTNSLNEKDAQKNLNTAEARIAADLKALIGGTLPLSPATMKKTKTH